MANHLYHYSSSNGAGGGTPKSSAASVYTTRSLADPYLSNSTHDNSKYYSSSIYDAFRYSAASSYLSSQQPWPPGVDPTVSDHLTSALKRPSEAWYSTTNSLAKRHRIESASNLPVYPQRPGEKDCAHYMLTRTCKFGDTCKFDHPIWVPEGGIPDWKEVPVITTSESLPERPGELDCPYFLKTQRCKFGFKCKFNHPKHKLISSGASGNGDVSALPERPFEPPCAFYMKSGTCKFGSTCKFHHPKGCQIRSAGQENGFSELNESVIKTDGTTGLFNPVASLLSHIPAMLHNSKGLPIRPGELDCPFYLKTGSCKYGSTCRYNHPERSAINPPAAAIAYPHVTSPAASLGIGVSPAASIYQTFDPRLAQHTLGVSPTIYPQRPGQVECDYYMKTGVCKFGENCKFHHPIDRSAVKPPSEETVKLTLAGLPRREGSVHCPYYMKTGTCKYGATCKFDHPPPGEVIARVTSLGTATAVSDEVMGNKQEVES